MTIDGIWQGFTVGCYLVIQKTFYQSSNLLSFSFLQIYSLLIGTGIIISFQILVFRIFKIYFCNPTRTFWTLFPIFQVTFHFSYLILIILNDYPFETYNSYLKKCLILYLKRAWLGLGLKTLGPILFFGLYGWYIY